VFEVFAFQYLLLFVSPPCSSSGGGIAAFNEVAVAEDAWGLGRCFPWIWVELSAWNWEF